MKSQRLARWSGSVLSPRTRPCPAAAAARVQALPTQGRRSQSMAAEEIDEDYIGEPVGVESISVTKKSYASHKHYDHLKDLPSPPISAALHSAKLSALHARLQLPSRLPLQTLAKCLIHPTADPDHRFNNSSLEILGQNILGYYTSELILCTYPRLPMAITYGAMKAYVGPEACASMIKEWGIESAAEPGGEVDPGFLQFVREIPGNADVKNDGKLHKDTQAKGKSIDTWAGMLETSNSLNSASIKSSYFGRLDEQATRLPEVAGRSSSSSSEGNGDGDKTARTTLEQASLSFVRALFGALYLHAGRDGAKDFFARHVRTRRLDVSQMFYFRQPTRDLSQLCAREGFERPVGRILSETGRFSRHPVFVLGVFSGREKLGEGTGASLDEARVRAAVSALKGWYLYSPLKVRVPSDVEGKGQQQQEGWEPVMIDGGEIIV